MRSDAVGTRSIQVVQKQTVSHTQVIGGLNWVHRMPRMGTQVDTFDFSFPSLCLWGTLKVLENSALPPTTLCTCTCNHRYIEVVWEGNEASPCAALRIVVEVLIIVGLEVSISNL